MGKTGIVAGALIAAVLVLLLGMLGWELYSIERHATFSELAWYVWARQPWVVWLVSVVVTFVVGFLSGHFWAQSSSIYEAERRKTWPATPVVK